MRLAGSDLACIRGGRLVFTGIDFSCAGGRSLLLTGPNGAGKSSLLRMIAGLIRPAAGGLALTGGDDELSIGEQAHYVGHVNPLKPALTVAENLMFWARFLNGGRDRDHARRAENGLAAVGLTDLAGLPAGYLSAGQRRRLSLARMLAVPRPIWLLDEPTSALDVASQERLLQVMNGHLAGGGIIIAATHGPLGLDQPGELRLGIPAGAEDAKGDTNGDTNGDAKSEVKGDAGLDAGLATADPLP